MLSRFSWSQVAVHLGGVVSERWRITGRKIETTVQPSKEVRFIEGEAGVEAGGEEGEGDEDEDCIDDLGEGGVKVKLLLEGDAADSTYLSVTVIIDFKSSSEGGIFIVQDRGVSVSQLVKEPEV